ncbi:MAG: tRNA (N6-isopentenyl adenosine(37)-C2)-methylthiotransferase MiaB [Bacteroides sp.]|nr:MAG: tRNA (N6-isopentenyl adenosine(37)-C2)-methylthiotransferase MiaB [Bacteroides sp.]
MNEYFKEKNFYIETYGCQMNFYDTEIVVSIMNKMGFNYTNNIQYANVILINTCSIRQNAEDLIIKRLNTIKNIIHSDTIVGIIGCMAERLKHKLLNENELITFVVGPDSYEELPEVLFKAFNKIKSCNVTLSRTQTYDNIIPTSINKNIYSYISIMRGCDNMCTFCVVPFTRGRERSKNPVSIFKEIDVLLSKNIKKIILIGQNVDSYKWKKNNDVVDFSCLLDQIAKKFPELIITFTTSHPKDMTEDVIYTISNNKNILKYIHLPIQSGSNKILNLMKRKYDTETFLQKIHFIRQIIPNCSISTDIMTGFCGETEKDHSETLNIMEKIKFNFAYMFKYSNREGTYASKKMQDNLSDSEKNNRLQEIIELQKKHTLLRSSQFIGKYCNILINGRSKKSNKDFVGFNEQNYKVIFPKKDNLYPGKYVNVLIQSYSHNTLIGKISDEKR